MKSKKQTKKENKKPKEATLYEKLCNSRSPAPGGCYVIIIRIIIVIAIVMFVIVIAIIILIAVVSIINVIIVIHTNRHPSPIATAPPPGRPRRGLFGGRTHTRTR